MDTIKKRKKMIIIGFVIAMVLLVGGVYAWLTFRTNDILIAGNTHCFTINYSKGADITGNIGAIKEDDYITGNTIKLSTLMGFTPISLELDSRCYKVSGIATIELNIVSLSTAFTSEGNSYGSLKYVVAEYDPKKYTDSTMQYLKNQTFTYVTRGIITTDDTTMDIHTEYLEPGEVHNYLIIVYIDKNLVGDDIIGASVSATATARAEQFVASPISDFNYVTDYYEGVEVPEGYILLTEYTGEDEVVNVPASYTIDGVEYKVIILSDTVNDTSTFAGNTDITNVNFAKGVTFYEFAGGEVFGENSVSGLFSGCTSLVTAPKLPDTITNMNVTYAGCTSLTSVEYIPTSVTSMLGTFFGCSSLGGYIRIYSENVTVDSGTFGGTTSAIIVEAPANSETYTNLEESIPNNVTVVPLGRIDTFTPITDFLYVIGNGNDEGDEITSIPIYACSDCLDGNNNETTDGSREIYDYDIPNLYLEENEILLTGYTGNSTEIKIPNTYTIDGVTYNVVILSYVDLYFEQSGGGGGSPKGMSSSYNKDISAKPLNYSINTRYNSKLIVKDNEEEDYYYPCWGYGLLNYNPTVEVIELGENILGVYINAYDGYCDYGVIDYAFQNDSSLVNVPVIPSASSSYGTFEGCTNLAGTIRFYDCSPNFLDSINPSTVENEIVLEIPSDSAVTEFLSELNASLAENYPNMSITTFENDSCPVDSGGGGGDTGK